MLRLVVLTALTLIAFASNSLLARAALAGGSADAAGFTLVRIASGALALWVLVSLRERRPLLTASGCWAGGLHLATYAVAFSFGSLVTIVTFAFGQIWSPYVYNHYDEPYRTG